MASSIIIKNENGQIKGYVLVKKDSLLVMVKGNGERGRLILLSDNGMKEECDVICDGKETRIPYYGDTPTGGYLTTNTATKEVDTEEKEKVSEEKNENLCKYNGFDPVYKEEKETQPVPAGKDRMNRWPPPPCWPTARYVGGIWCD